MALSIRVLQYDFLGPVRLSEWGPPMKETVYLVMSQDGGTFRITYAGDCKDTDKADYLTKNPKFGCWLQNGRSEEQLYISILPMHGSADVERARVIGRIVDKYAPICNQ